MPDNEIKREKTFSEELPYFKERIKEVFDNSDNPDGYADMLYLSALRDSHRIVRKAEEEIIRQQEEIERLTSYLQKCSRKLTEDVTTPSTHDAKQWLFSDLDDTIDCF